MQPMAQDRLENVSTPHIKAQNYDSVLELPCCEVFIMVFRCLELLIPVLDLLHDCM